MFYFRAPEKESCREREQQLNVTGAVRGEVRRGCNPHAPQQGWSSWRGIL